MDFFAAQAEAQRRTRWLLLLFILAVMGIVTAIYLASVIVPYVWREPELGSKVLTFGMVPLVLYLLYRAWQEGSGIAFIVIAVSSGFVACAVATTMHPGTYPLSMSLGNQLADIWAHPEVRVKALAIWTISIIMLTMFHALFRAAMDVHDIDYIVPGILLSFACVVLTAYYFYHDQRSADVEQNVLSLWNAGSFWLVCLLVGGGIMAASILKIRQITRYGGRLIAEQLGGRMVMRDTYNRNEKRLLNVVDEMSIAAGIPAPVVYVLPYESGLNAFAAGLTTRDCVIGVTRGLLEAMDRDELQGVVAHEVSHIVNGDSRLNLKIIGTLYGIHLLTLMGQWLMRSGGAVAAFGYVVNIAGFIGVFLGRIIQAAVSREREYLADAAAVQFTRNPYGLISALQKLQTSGSVIDSPNAVVTSHLFLGVSDEQDTLSAFLFDTHPPLSERILRLGGMLLDQSDEEARPSAKATTFAEEDNVPVLAANPYAAMPDIAPISVTAAAAAAEAARLSATTENLSPAQMLLDEIPATLRQPAYSFGGATGILAGLLFSRKPDILAKQEELLVSGKLAVARNLYQWLGEQPDLGARYRLVLVDLILPTLREAFNTERQQVITLAKDLMRADGRVTPTKFAIYSLIHTSLMHPERDMKRGELRPEQLDRDISNLLALLAYSGHKGKETAQAAYEAAIVASPAGRQYPFPAKSELTLNRIADALLHLSLATLPYRKKFLDACELSIHHDGKLAPAERELFRAFSQSLDCPAPLA